MLKRLFWFRHERRIKRLLNNGLQVGQDTIMFNEDEDYGYNYNMVRIGSRCVIASGVKFITNPAIIKCMPDLNHSVCNEIVVCDNSFLGINSIIYPGVVIGPNSIVGAGAVVTEDVPPNMCVSGNPLQVNCTVDFYRSICKRGAIPEYRTINKRELLKKYFWGNNE